MPFEWTATGMDAQRAAVIGKTGSGKTTLGKRLAAGAAACVWFDTKGLNDPGWPVHEASEFYQATMIDKMTPTGVRQRMVLQGDPYALAAALQRDPHITIQASQDRTTFPPADQLDAIAEACYLLGNLLFAVDDAMGVLKSQPPVYVTKVLTEGRARGIGTLAMFQRAHNIPLVLMTEAEHLVLFQLAGQSDVDRIVTESQQPALSECRGLAPHEYLWFDRNAAIVERFKPLPLQAAGTRG